MENDKSAIVLSEDEIRQLEKMAEDEDSAPTLRTRAEILIALTSQKSDADIAREIGVTPPTVKRVRKAYLEKGLSGILRKERDKTQPVSYKSVYRCPLGITGSSQVVGICLDSDAAAIIIEKSSFFTNRGTGIGSVEVKGKAAVGRANELADNGTLTMSDAIRVAMNNGYNRPASLSLFDFYSAFKDGYMLPVAQYEIIYFTEESFLVSIALIAGHERNVRLINMDSRQAWMRAIKPFFTGMDDANAGEKILRQISGFFNNHQSIALPFWWFQDKPETGRQCIVSEVQTEKVGVSKLPDHFVLRFPLDEVLQGESDNARIVMWGILVDKTDGKYSVRSTKSICSLQFPDPAIKVKAMPDFQRLISEYDREGIKWTGVFEQKLSELFSDALQKGMTTSFEDEAMFDRHVDMNCDISSFRERTDGARLFLVVMVSRNPVLVTKKTYGIQISHEIVSPNKARESDEAFQEYLGYFGNLRKFTKPLIEQFFNSLMQDHY
ncbi:MAG: helix-turn-helix domain-containing protein [Clostridia bacterium]|nr:helix-turn-helix domain-containing protein [Clostridia bacterium]